MMLSRYIMVWIICKVAYASGDYYIGAGIADITGPPAEVTFMGFADFSQKGEGLHLRQFSRAFIFRDDKTSIVFVSIDAAMLGQAVRHEVLNQLNETYGDLYTEDNVLISATHTHSTPGGYMLDMLFDASVMGFVKQSFDALVSGITLSVIRAHESLVKGHVTVVHDELLDVNINRSPLAYLNNPASERLRYKYDVDKNMVQLKLSREDGYPIGVINWYAIHPNTMNKTNHLVSTDNVGFASVLFEQQMNKGALIGKGPFIAAFASSNLGDVSPNIKGPRCQLSGEKCDELTSTCSNREDLCIASGPGKDMFESTRILSERLFNKAWELWNREDRDKVSGNLQAVHQFVHMPSQEAEYVDPDSGIPRKVHGCMPAMGYSFGAGTTDGPGIPVFHQGTLTSNPFWTVVRDMINTPPADQVRCHHPKPILLYTGEMSFPYEWQPKIVSTHIALLGNMVLACVPGEFTTMSGRRLRDTISSELGITTQQVIIVGLCNIYSDYVATPEEYQIQRYEGASTIFGPYTLSIYLKQFQKLAAALKQQTPVEPGPEPEIPTNRMSLVPSVIYDTPKWNYKFGDCLLQPKKDAHVGDTIITKFVSGHPRNNLTHEWTYLTIERLDESGQWQVVATDANWETKFKWIRLSPVLGTSEVHITWTIGEDVKSGTYRIRHFGSYKQIFGTIVPYEGSSDNFQVHNEKHAWSMMYMQSERTTLKNIFHR